MTESTEQRKHQRVEAHIPVKYCKLRNGAGIKRASSVSKDLSQGGVRFRTAEFISMACRLILELDMPMFTKSVKAISRVAWIRKAASVDSFEVGSQFIEMSEEDKELISEYVSKLNPNSKSEISISWTEVAGGMEEKPETEAG